MSLTQSTSMDRLNNVLRYLGGIVYHDSNRSILPFIPRPLRYLLVLLLLVNIRSFPFAWHYRMISPIAKLRIKWWLLKLKFSSGPSKDKWLDSLQPIGRSPFDTTIFAPYKSWASPDESDYNIHLSNSSYAKTLDAVRLRCSLEGFLAFFRDGGWIALAGVHFSFIREIPIGARFEVRSSIGSWDGKWVYFISRFVSKSKRATAANDEKRKRLADAQAALAARNNDKAGIPTPAIHTPAMANDLGSGSGIDTPSVQEFSKHVLEESDDDSVLHCVAVSQVCFKSGRITVPPALVLAANGFGISKDKWEDIKQLRSRRPAVAGEEPRLSMRELYKGGWRDVPTEDRWWDQAFAGMEEQRVRRLEEVSRLKEGMEGARAL